ncbi:Uncharacterized protein YktB, UPF0637 family [Pilibacter termitis]|uniref:UPF0637 protein SAMN02745116_01563 n=1 Tax=Pilibacter termitis TaxID=263852 RepID=A0A1T4NWY9_9ENTE|nr:DUF1054 domain-containing protein [Pilibacter termitis]SJZ83577.1 Uncharacterized protein YktB, UPF0637 family [Pilibacter termitis]
MFLEKDFQVFDIEGLDSRMTAIRANIQPVFQAFWEEFAPKIAREMNEEEFIHIAQHRRRTTYAPENTWSAISTSKRGYKAQPHFQLGIWKDYVFMYLSMIDQPKNEKEIANCLLGNIHLLKQLPSDFVYSKDHMVSDYFPIDEQLEQAILRFRDVKKGEFEIGRVILRNDSIWQNEEKAKQKMWETYQTLLPIYKIVYEKH